MKHLLKLTAIGLLSGYVLALTLKLVMAFTGNTAYVLLFNFDYIPVVKDLKPVWLFGYVFHYLTCIISAIVLFYILKTWNWQKVIFPYIIVYTIGGGAFFFLNVLVQSTSGCKRRHGMDLLDGCSCIIWLCYRHFGKKVDVMDV